MRCVSLDSVFFRFFRYQGVKTPLLNADVRKLRHYAIGVYYSTSSICTFPSGSKPSKISEFGVCLSHKDMMFLFLIGQFMTNPIAECN